MWSMCYVQQQTMTRMTSYLFLMFIPQVISASTPANNTIYCRDSWVQEMPYEEFAVYSCSKCFVQVFWAEKDLTILFPPTPPYLLIPVDDLDGRSGNMTTYYPDAESPNSEVCERALSSDECRMWKSCCQAAKDCCMHTQQDKIAAVNNTCPSTWDGIGCWGATSAGQRAQQSCPNYYVLDEVKWSSPRVFRQCDQYGTWQINPNTSQEFSDYQECFNQSKNIMVLRASLYINFVGNGISIILLVSGIIIIVSFRNLRTDLQQRTGLKIHFNLFVSVLCTASFTVAFHSIYHDAFTSHNPVYQQNTIWCRSLHIMMKYFKSTTYMCMFCEGLFLYRRISQVMQIGHKESLPKYIIIGWVVPLITVGIYVVVRVALGHNERCWIDDSGLSELEYIYLVPNLCSLVCNLIFLISIQYMLCTKMRSDTSDRRVEVLRHAIRATMSLIPIFGLQFLFLIYRPKHWPPYEIIAAIFVSTQGTLVAVLYCFTTKEVQTQLDAKGCGCVQAPPRGPMSKQTNYSKANGRSNSVAVGRSQVPTENTTIGRRKSLNAFRKGVNRLIQSRHSEKRRRKHRFNIVDKGVCLEVVQHRRDSSESRTTQHSRTDSVASSINSQHKGDLKKNGLTKIHHSHAVPLESMEMHLFDDDLQRQANASVHVHIGIATEHDETDVMTPLVSDMMATSNVDHHVIDRLVSHILSPIDETESQSNTDS